MTSGLPYLVVIKGQHGPLDCFGPVRSINAEAAAKQAVGHMADMNFGSYTIDVYPVSVGPEGEAESEEIDPEVLKA